MGGGPTLDAGLHYAEISRDTGASTATITRIASWLNHGEGGYRAVLDRQERPHAAGPAPTPRSGAMSDAPSPGHPQQGPAGRADPRGCCTTPASSSRSTTAAWSRAVQNFELDILFVRTNDIIEFVGDGVADLGITGTDLLSETGAELPRIRELGYGRCRLAAAVPNDSPIRTIADLAGLRVATAHPNTARRFFEREGVPVEIIPISGAVEVAPRLGPGRGDRRPRLDRLDAGHERAAPGRRRARLRGDPRRATRLPTERGPTSWRRSTRCSVPSSPPGVAST